MADPQPAGRWRLIAAVLLTPVWLLFWVNPGILGLGLFGAVHSTVHYGVARLLGIPVQLQLGFGPTVWSLPLGSRSLAFGVLPGAMAWPRFEGVSGSRVAAYLAAGPIGSLLVGGGLAALLFGLVAWRTPDAAPQIGMIEHDSAAARAGLQVGDVVVEHDGATVRNWREASEALVSGGMLTIRREGGPVMQAVPSLGADHGASPVQRNPIVTALPGGAWENGGVHDGDFVLALDGHPVTNWRDVEALADDATTVRVDRGGYEFDLAVEPGDPRIAFADRLVGGVLPGGPADQAGLRAGDRIVSIGGVAVEDWAHVPALVNQDPPLALVFERRGAEHTVMLSPESVVVDGVRRSRVGIERFPSLYADPVETVERGVFESGTEGVRRTLEAAQLMVDRLAALVSPTPSGPAALGGPVVLSGGPVDWLSLFATVFVNLGLALGLYNLLPLPASDALTALDTVVHRTTGRRLPTRGYAITAIGFVMLLLGVVMAMDVSRFVAGF